MCEEFIFDYVQLHVQQTRINKYVQRFQAGAECIYFTPDLNVAVCKTLHFSAHYISEGINVLLN